MQLSMDLPAHMPHMLLLPLSHRRYVHQVRDRGIHAYVHPALHTAYIITSTVPSCSLVPAYQYPINYVLVSLLIL